MGLATRRTALLAAALLAAALIAAAFPGAAEAATIDVTTNADVLNSGDGPDAIRVPAGAFALTLAPAGEDAALGGDLDVTGSLEISGAGTSPGPAGTDVTAEGDRIFDIRLGAVVTISNLCVRNGIGGNAGPAGNGGANHSRRAFRIVASR